MGSSFSTWFEKLSPAPLAETSKTPARSNRVIYIVIAFSILITFGAWLYASNTLDRQAEEQFNKEVSTVSKTIQSTIEDYVNASYGIKGLFAASDSVNRDEFSAYITELNLRERYPGLVAIYYAPKVALQDQKAFIKSVREEGYPTFEVNPPTSKDAFIVNFIEPYNLYKNAHGFNPESETTQMKAMDQARDTGKPAITSKVTLQNAERTERAFIVYFPIYDNNLPTYTVKERQAAIKGYVGAVFNGTTFFQSVIGDTLGSNRISLSVYDEEEMKESDLFYKNTIFTEGVPSDTFFFKDTMSIPAIGSTWTLKFSTLENFSLPILQELFPTIVLVAGIIFIILLFTSLYTLSTGKQRALEIVDQMTFDLRVYADIVKNMTEGLLVFKRTEHENKQTFTLTLANPISEAELQKSPQDTPILGKLIYDLFPHLEEKGMLEKFLDVLSTKQTLEFEDTRTTKSGLRTFLTKVFAMPNESIGITYVDITDQKEIQKTLRTHSDELQKLNSFMVDRELKMVELKKELSQLKGSQ